MDTCKVKDTSFSICYQLCELSYILGQSNWPFSLIILFWSRNISLIIHFHGPNVLIIINKWLLQLYDFFIQHKFSLFLVGSDEHNPEVVSREKNIYYFEHIELEKICIWDKLTFSSIAWNHSWISCPAEMLCMESLELIADIMSKVLLQYLLWIFCLRDSTLDLGYLLCRLFLVKRKNN